MSFEKLTLAASYLTGTIYAFNEPKEEGIMPLDRKDMTDIAKAAVAEHYLNTKTVRTEWPDINVALFFSNIPEEIEEIKAIQAKYKERKRHAGDRD